MGIVTVLALGVPICAGEIRHIFRWICRARIQRHGNMLAAYGKRRVCVCFCIGTGIAVRNIRGSVSPVALVTCDARRLFTAVENLQ